ncbi:hypothetical protein [Myxococcus vastator]|nr:hypothetical protein [Myxococcus vastator]
MNDGAVAVPWLGGATLPHAASARSVSWVSMYAATVRSESRAAVKAAPAS